MGDGPCATCRRSLGANKLRLASAPNFVNDAAAAAHFQSRAPLRLAIRKLRQNPIVQDECLYA